jgi:pilus assembly protein FimV
LGDLDGLDGFDLDAVPDLASAPDVSAESVVDELDSVPSDTETQTAELDSPLEVENLDDIDLDLGDMDLSDLLEEVAASEEAGVPDELELPAEVESSVNDELDAPQASDESSLEELAELDDLDLAEMMADLGAVEEVDLSEVESDLDADLAALDSSLDDLENKAVPANPVEEELTANIVHDLDAELDSELQSLLDGSDGDIELEEVDADEEDLADVDGWSLLEGADEVETKLDLARAYMDMEDADGARDILKEIVQEGSDKQKQEAGVLLESIKQ